MTYPPSPSESHGLSEFKLEAATERLMIWVDHCRRCRLEHGPEHARARTAHYLLQAAIRQELTQATAASAACGQ